MPYVDVELDRPLRNTRAVLDFPTLALDQNIGLRTRMVCFGAGTHNHTHLGVKRKKSSKPECASRRVVKRFFTPLDSARAESLSALTLHSTYSPPLEALYFLRLK